MDKNAIKKYAIWARRELIERVSQRAMAYGITATKIDDANADVVGGRVLSSKEKKQRQALVDKIKEKGFEQVVEEVAYTWFNRFAALRFMEVNGYLPTHVRVFTNDAGEFKPQILSEALHLDLEGLDKNKVYELVTANRSEELFKYLLVLQCNALHHILPGMFQWIEDYTELLLPDYLLREGSVVERMVTTIPEADWTDQVQIIGWLYQYYNAELKDKVFADLKKNIKISKEHIPAATQLFTPDWIVRYMVENSLGRLWLEGHPNDALKSEWKYYLDEAEQEPEVEAQLAAIRKEYAALKPEDIRVIDPCMGSGHILCVFFDVLVRIYEECGYSAREATVKIVEKNLWGLDIDDRAAQLAYFAVMMKARRYDRRFLDRGVQPHVYAFQETNNIQNEYEHAKSGFNLSKEHQATLDYLIGVFDDAKEYGSTLRLEKLDYVGLKNEWEQRKSSKSLFWSEPRVRQVSHLIDQAIALSQEYYVAVTNPPYMDVAKTIGTLVDYSKKNYPDSKSDLFAIFIERIRDMIHRNGYQAMITQHAWMFLTSYEKLRVKFQSTNTVNMVHLGARAFEEIGGEVVQTTSFVFRRNYVDNYRGVYVRLVEPITQKGKEDIFLTGLNRYVAKQNCFSKIPGSPIAYWVSDRYVHIFSNKRMDDYGNSCIGMRTGDNNRFLRLWYEVALPKIGIGYSSAEEAQKSGKKWFPYCKGGHFRKWYGNNEFLVNWENDGYEIKENTRRVYPTLGDNLGWKISNEHYYFQPGITWSGVGTRGFGVRCYPKGMIFDSGANSFIVKDTKLYYYFAGLLNSVIMSDVIDVINPTINTGNGVVAQLPAIVCENVIEYVSCIVKECVETSKADWNAFETSWEFSRHPFIANFEGVSERDKKTLISQKYKSWEEKTETRFQKLKENEEALNRIFLDIYELTNELPSKVDVRDVTVSQADLQRDVRSFVSYAVGCMFGRYSLDVPGLVYAGGEWDASKYATFPADEDAIIPICDDEYFSDDIVGRFVKFVEVVFGKETLEENLRFIADALGGKGAAREAIRKYFINDFYADHLKVYQKRPIYWLFDSGKKNGFKCLIYMHRYQPDTLARIRTNYVHEQQARYRATIDDLEKRVEGATTSERVKLSKKLAALKAQAEELRIYEEKIHHLADQMINIDLDDGVVHNYEIFKDVLAKRK